MASNISDVSSKSGSRDIKIHFICVNGSKPDSECNKFLVKAFKVWFAFIFWERYYRQKLWVLYSFRFSRDDKFGATNLSQCRPSFGMESSLSLMQIKIQSHHFLCFVLLLHILSLFQAMTKAGFNPRWTSDGSCLSLKRKPRSELFVLPEFNGQVFDHLHSLKCS